MDPPDSERLLIDGYNLIKTVPRFRRREQVSLEAARRTLEQVLRTYARRVDAQILLFYDGDEAVDLPLRNQGEDRLRIFFSCPPEKADDLIKRQIQQSHGARRVRVVSSDREIRAFARRHKIRSVSSDEFDEELERRPASPQAPEPQPTPREFDPDLVLDEQEIEAWERLFEKGEKRNP